VNRRSWGFLIGGLLVALLLAGVVSNFASSRPDGLDSSLREGCVFDANDHIVSGDCPAKQAREHEMADSPLAGYGFRGIDNPYLSTGLSGVIGVLLTFTIGGGVFWLVRRRGPAAGPRRTPSAGPRLDPVAGGADDGAPADVAGDPAR
jgi:cobalt/nickel transport protein